MNKQYQYADVTDKVGTVHSYDQTNFGDGNTDGAQFSDQDLTPARVLKQCNVINSTDDDYAGNSVTVTERIFVDNSRADRGKEA